MESFYSFLKLLEVAYWIFIFLSLIVCIIYIDKINILMYKQTIFNILNVISDKVNSIKITLLKIFKKR